MQRETEAIFKVSHYDINEQRANFDTLHEKPDPLPSKQNTVMKTKTNPKTGRLPRMQKT